jgi:hypothetical protein
VAAFSFVAGFRFLIALSTGNGRLPLPYPAFGIANRDDIRRWDRN